MNQNQTVGFRPTTVLLRSSVKHSSDYPVLSSCDHVQHSHPFTLDGQMARLIDPVL